MSDVGLTPDANAEARYLALHAAISAEITRLRNDQWILSGYFISEALGIIYLFASDTLKGLILNSVSYLAAAIQVIAVIVFLYHIGRLHNFLYVHRVIRRKIEGKLGFHDVKDHAGEFIFPLAWRNRSVDRWFEFNSVVIPLSAFVFLTQALSIYVILVPVYVILVR